MSQFQPPPFPPGGLRGGPTVPMGPVGPRPYSALAITAFVLSLLGFLGCTAVLGIILGIAGIMVTRAGRRRGMGLAIAAIPISLVTGILSLVLVAIIVFAVGMKELPSKVESVLSSDAGAKAQAVAALREFASPDFNKAVTEAGLDAWLADVHETHGKLVELEVDPTTPVGKTPEGKLAINLAAKFINGPVTIRLTLSTGGGWKFVLDDITVGGLSPRDSR